MHTVATAVAIVLAMVVAYLLFAEIGVPSGGGSTPSPGPDPDRPDTPRYLNQVQDTAVALDAAVASWVNTATSLVALIPSGEQIRDAAQHVAALPDGSEAAAINPTAALADSLSTYRATTMYYAGTVTSWTPATASAVLMSAKPTADGLPAAVLGIADRFAADSAALQNLHDAWVSEYNRTVVHNGCSGYECPPCSNGMKCVGARRIFDATTGTFTCVNGDCVPVMNDSMATYLKTLAHWAAAADSEAAPSGDLAAKAAAAQRAYAGLFSYIAGAG